MMRFLFGFPFSIVFLALVVLATGDTLRLPMGVFWLWLLLGTLTQIAATALMLAAMNERSFVVTTAYIKTEPILAALFGFVFLSDHLAWWKLLAIVIATSGVVITAIRPGGERSFAQICGRPRSASRRRPASRCRRSAIAARSSPFRMSRFVTAATFTLMLGLGVQTLVLAAYLLLRDRKTMFAILRLWKPSLLAGFMGAFASQFWFLAFALTNVANVRTLALIEVLFAQAISHYKFKQPATTRELAGIALIVLGVALLVGIP
jgi:drug/metabolite transporter (DMT)-like permease